MTLRLFTACAVLAFAALVACGGPVSSTDDAGTDAGNPPTDGGSSDGGADGGLVCDPDAGLDTSQAGLTQLVRCGVHKSWDSETSIHVSAGNPPHEYARVFLNKPLYLALKGGQPSFPIGSVAVKELYTGSTADTHNGYAVLAKEDGGWVFYQGYAPSYDDTYLQGTLNNSCADCHKFGTDMIWSAPSAFP